MHAKTHDLQTLFDIGVLGDRSDGELLGRFVERREEAVFEAIVRRHGPMVWGVCRRVLRDDHDAEDAFQATFLVLARRASSIVPREKLGNWLYGVAYQTARNARAMRAKRRAREGHVSDMPEHEVVSDDLRDELTELLDRELSRLPEKYRIPIVLCDLEGRTHREAAGQLGWPIGTVSSRLSRARAILAKRLAGRGLSLSVGSMAALLAQESASASMPTQLVGPTAQAASLFAAGGTVTTGGVSARVAALTGEVLKIMLIGRLKVATAMLLMVSATVFALVRSAARTEATVVRDAAMEKPGDRPETEVAKPALPPRAMVQIGTDDLRIRNSFITGIAFSPDGRLIAAAEANAPVPRVSLFDVRTGRLAKSISPPDRPRGWVHCVAFSPDQTRLAWGEVGGEVAIWDLTQDRLQFREKLHGQGVSDVMFSPDGQILASGGEDGVVQLRRAGDPRDAVQALATGESQPARHRAFSGGPPAGGLPVGPLRLAFTPDGTRLIVGSGSSATISLWRIRDGQLVRRIEAAHGNPRGSDAGLGSIAVTPDGRRILSAGERTVPITQTKLKYGPRNVTLTEIRLWDLRTGERVKDLQGEEDYGRGYAALSRDGRHVAVGDYGQLRIIDATTGRLERTMSLPGSWGNPPTFSPDGTLVAMAIGNVLSLFDVRTGRRLHHDERTPEGDLQAAAWSPTGDRIVTGHSDGRVRVWEAATGQLAWHTLLAPAIGVHGENAGPAFVAFTRDGRHIVAAGRRHDPVKHSGGAVAVFDASDGTMEREDDQKTEVRWAALAPDGRMVVVATSYGAWGDTHLVGVEVETGRTRWTNPPEEERVGFVQVAGMQFQSDSSLLEVALRDGNVVRFNGLTGREQRRFLADGRPPDQQGAGRPRRADMLFTAAFSADGRTMVSSSDEWVCVWDIEAGTLRRRIRHTSANGCFLALAPDGKTIATSGVPYAGTLGEDNTIRLYDTESGDPVLALEPADDRAHTLAFSPDGTKLLTGFQRGSLIIWDLRREQEASREKE